MKYLKGDPFPDERFEWAGVFICSSEDMVESAFASSEPPAHDDWCANNLPKGHQKTFVNVGLRELKSKADSFVNPTGVHKVETESGTSLAETASKIGTLLNQTSGKGPGKAPGSGSSGIRQNKKLRPYFEKLETTDSGQLLSVFKAELPTGLAGNVMAEPFLVLDGGKTGQQDLPQELTAGIYSIALLGTDKRTDQPELTIDSDVGELEIRVKMPGDAAVGLNLHLKQKEILE